ncbi:13174_t:CDS:2, partial [Ambispora gerdemannii]
ADHKSSEWTIMDESDAELFTDKIEYYLTSLKNIPNQRMKKVVQKHRNWILSFKSLRRATKLVLGSMQYPRLSDVQDSKSIWWDEKNQIEIVKALVRDTTNFPSSPVLG